MAYFLTGHAVCIVQSILIELAVKNGLQQVAQLTQRDRAIHDALLRHTDNFRSETVIDKEQQQMA